MKFVRDTAGEAPKNQVELTGDLDRPVATLDLRSMSEEELLRLVEEQQTGADEAPAADEAAVEDE
jgi:phage FluMu protein gp41